MSVDSERKRFGMYLDLLLQSRGIAYKQMAGITGCSEGTVRKWITEGHLPRKLDIVLKKICDGYKLPANIFNSSSIFDFGKAIDLSPQQVMTFRLFNFDYTKVPFFYSFARQHNDLEEMKKYIGFFVLYRYHDDQSYINTPILRLPCKISDEGGVFTYSDCLNRDYGSPAIKYIGYLFWAGGLITIVGEEKDAKNSREIFWCTLNRSNLEKPDSLTGIISGIDMKGAPASYKTLLRRISEAEWQRYCDGEASDHYITKKSFSDETINIRFASKLVEISQSELDLNSISATKIH